MFLNIVRTNTFKFSRKRDFPFNNCWRNYNATNCLMVPKPKVSMIVPLYFFM